MYTSRFGTYWLNNGFTAQSLSTTPTLFTTWSTYQNGPGVEATGSGRLVIRKPGYYIARLVLSCNVQAGRILYVQMRENGAGNDFVSSVEGLTSGGRVNIALDAGGHPGADSYVEVYVWANVANTTFTPVSGVFYVMSC